MYRQWAQNKWAIHILTNMSYCPQKTPRFQFQIHFQALIQCMAIISLWCFYYFFTFQLTLSKIYAIHFVSQQLIKLNVLTQSLCVNRWFSIYSLFYPLFNSFRQLWCGWQNIYVYVMYKITVNKSFLDIAFEIWKRVSLSLYVKSS